MNNLEKYNEIFMSRLRVSPDQIDNVTYHSVSGWDSIGHMSLIAALEEEFNVSFEPEDILSFTSYENGKNILRKMDVNM